MSVVEIGQDRVLCLLKNQRDVRLLALIQREDVALQISDDGDITEFCLHLSFHVAKVGLRKLPDWLDR